IRALIQEGKIQKMGERWQATVGLDELALPQNVRLLIERRLAHFSPECRTTLAVAAVLGRQFSSELLSRARNLSEDIVAEHVDEALRFYILMDEVQRTAGDGPAQQDVDLALMHDKSRQALAQWLN